MSILDDASFVNEIAKRLMDKAVIGEISLLPYVYLEVEWFTLLIHGEDPSFRHLMILYNAMTGRIWNKPINVLSYGVLKDWIQYENGCSTDLAVRIPFVARITIPDREKEVPCLFIPIKKPGESITRFEYAFIEDEVELNRLFVEGPKYRMDLLEWEIW